MAWQPVLVLLRPTLQATEFYGWLIAVGGHKELRTWLLWLCNSLDLFPLDRNSVRIGKYCRGAKFHGGTAGSGNSSKLYLSPKNRDWTNNGTLLWNLVFYFFVFAEQRLLIFADGCRF